MDNVKRQKFVINSQGEVKIDGIINLGDIKGDIENKVNIIPEYHHEVKDLLLNLVKLVDTDALLPENEKKLALEQIKKIAEFAKSKVKEGTQQVLQTAIQILKGTLVDGTTELLQKGKEILAEITNNLIS